MGAGGPVRQPQPPTADGGTATDETDATVGEARGCGAGGGGGGVRAVGGRHRGQGCIRGVLGAGMRHRYRPPGGSGTFEGST